MFSKYGWQKGVVLGMAFSLIVSGLVNAEEKTVNEPGPAACWNFDEGSGNIAKDSSGNNNDGTIYGKAAWVEGVSGKALSFAGFYLDAANYSDDCVKCEKDSGLQSTSFTVEVWVKFDQFKGEWQCIVQKGTMSAANQGHNWVLGEISSQKKIGFGTWGNPAYFSSIPTYEFSTGRWYHLAGVMDNGNVTLYVNGVARPSVLSDYKSPNNDILTLGRASQSVAFYLKGTIDEVKIYSVALSAQDIKNHYEAHSQKK